jgi:hypothetical protein
MFLELLLNKITFRDLLFKRKKIFFLVHLHQPSVNLLRGKAGRECQRHRDPAEEIELKKEDF